MTELEGARLSVEVGLAVAEFWGNYTAHLTIYLTLLFAYCVGMYAAADKLDRLQIGIATGLFVVAAELQVFSMIAWATAVVNTLHNLSELNPHFESRATIAPELRLFSIVIWQAGILAPLLFMWRVRHPKTE